MKNQVTVRFDGKKHKYFLNGELYRTSKREYKYACVATWESGKSVVISLGNKKDSTYNSMAKCYPNCSLEVLDVLK